MVAGPKPRRWPERIPSPPRTHLRYNPPVTPNLELAKIEVGDEADLRAILDRAALVEDAWAVESIARLVREVVAHREDAGNLAPPDPERDAVGQLKDRLQAWVKRARMLGPGAEVELLSWGDEALAEALDDAIDREAEARI